ncbi:Uncharacterised protein [Yersinia aldovae]|uniref:Uncharacterized protein n=1 Tax=Yersinia aldovae TaxID=29483 RepID=A0ABM9SZB2_YERAL|nr:Uncharacterised protein [Yersinia aldovae]
MDLPGYFYLLLRKYIILLNLNHHLTVHHADRQRLPGPAALRQPFPRQIQFAVILSPVRANMGGAPTSNNSRLISASLETNIIINPL